MQTIATAALQSCRNGQVTRRGVTRALPNVRDSFDPARELGVGSIDAHHELIGSRYWMYQIEGDTYRLTS